MASEPHARSLGGEGKDERLYIGDDPTQLLLHDHHKVLKKAVLKKAVSAASPPRGAAKRATVKLPLWRREVGKGEPGEGEGKGEPLLPSLLELPAPKKRRRSASEESAERSLRGDGGLPRLKQRSQSYSPMLRTVSGCPSILCAAGGDPAGKCSAIMSGMSTLNIREQNKRPKIMN